MTALSTSVSDGEWLPQVQAGIHRNSTTEMCVRLDRHLLCINLRRTRVHRAVQSDVRKLVELPPDSFSILAAQTTVSSAAIDPNEYILFAFEPDYVDRVAWERSDGQATTVNTCLSQVDPGFTALGRLARSYFLEGRPGGANYLDALSTMLAVRMIDYTSGSRTRLQEPPVPGNSPRIAQAIEYLHANLDKDLSLLSLAEKAAMSPYHFARSFKKVTGMPPHRFIVQCRVERAQSMLSSSTTSLAEIALSVGFASQSHMSAVFSRVLGVSPGKYRRSVVGD